MPVTIRHESLEYAARIGQVTEITFRYASHTCRCDYLLVDALGAAGALSHSLEAA